MLAQDAVKVAVRELTKLYKAVKRDVMASPRAEELRAERLAELEQTLAALGIVRFEG